MLYLILYIVGILVYLCLSFPVQLIFLLLNSFVPDPIPYIDEIIMYAGIIKKIINAVNIIDWIKKYPKISIIIGSVLLILIIGLLMIWI